MSSNEEDNNNLDFGTETPLQYSKKRRIQRACDICRRKKIRCDGGQMSDNRCSNCVTYNLPCTYVEAAKKRGPPKGYVESLENRVEKLEKLLRKICPDKDLLKELNASFDSLDPAQHRSSDGSSPNAFVGAPRDIATSALRKVDDITKEEQDDDSAHLVLTDNLRRISIDPLEYRFFGKSSGAMLIQTAMELKDEYTGLEPGSEKKALTTKRPEYWTTKSWEQSSAISQKPKYTFPPDDLLTALIDLYFQHFNLFHPLLHRPTFERSIAEGLHHTNDNFGAVLLLVCSVGARYSDDRRVVLESDDGLHSCGWKWFEQVQVVRRNPLSPPDLYDLQMHCLSVQYLRGSSAPHSCWTMVGIGIRLAQDVGAHRRKVHTTDWTVEDELRKRAFWVLVAIDRHLSCGLGRPCAIQDEDFDLDYPLEVDDEYWEHPEPERRFKQPPGKPSLVTAFNLYLKLNQLLAFTLRTIYAINKSKMLLGFVGGQWEQHIVAELDSALNRWVDSVPDHLRWDPNREHPQFFQQSVLLYACYYHLQILIHRPFIPSPRKPSPLSFPSLAICTNAARSCSHVVDVMKKRDLTTAPWIIMQVFTVSIVLLLNIWGGKRSGFSTDTQKEMAEVHKCMSVLRVCEARLYSAGRLWDILYELASVGELPLPEPSPLSSNKRERDEETPTSQPSNTLTEIQEGPRPVVGSKRASHATSQAELARHHQGQYELPVHSNELGQLPLHNNYPVGNQQIGNRPGYWPAAPSGMHSQQQFSQVPLEQGSSQTLGLGNAPRLAYSQATPMPVTLDFPQHPSNVVGGPIHGQVVPPSRLEMDPLLARAYFSGREGVENVLNMTAGTPSIDYDTMAMWSNAPTGFEIDDWGIYSSGLSANGNW